jgi:RHS repeat-associated protein
MLATGIASCKSKVALGLNVSSSWNRVGFGRNPNHLTSATERDADGNTLTAVTYSYDALGNRISETVTDGGGNPSTTQFAYDPSGQLVAEMADSGQWTSYLANPQETNDFLARVDGSGVTWLLTDHQGSVTVALSADGSQVLAQATYDAFGNATLVSGTPTDLGRLGFQGGMTDAPTAFVHFGDRDYDPTTGRWRTPDPANVDINTYRGMGNSPTNYTDPSGQGPAPALPPQAPPRPPVRIYTPPAEPSTGTGQPATGPTGSPVAPPTYAHREAQQWTAKDWEDAARAYNDKLVIEGAINAARSAGVDDAVIRRITGPQAHPPGRGPNVINELYDAVKKVQDDKNKELRDLLHRAKRKGLRVVNKDDERHVAGFQYFVHGTTTTAWQGELSINPNIRGRSDTDFGFGFYAYRDTAEGQRAAEGMAVRTRQRVRGIAFVMVVAISDTDWDRLDTRHLTGDEWRYVVNSYRGKQRPRGMDNYSVVYGKVGVPDEDNRDRWVPSKTLPDQYRFTAVVAATKLHPVAIYIIG